MTKNLQSALESMRPDVDIDELWPRHEQLAARDRIMATAPDITNPDPVVPAVRSRRVGAIAVVAAISVAGGVGIAAAAGLMPKAFTDAYSGWLNRPEGFAVDPGAAERIASLPGPDGMVFSVFVAHGADGWRCVAPVFESAEDAQQPGPANFSKLGDYCRPDANTQEFGGGMGFMRDPHGIIFDAAAGDAVRAELHTTDGQVLPTVLVEGKFFGWAPMSIEEPRPTVVGYGADGTTVGVR